MPPVDDAEVAGFDPTDKASLMAARISDVMNRLYVLSDPTIELTGEMIEESLADMLRFEEMWSAIRNGVADGSVWTSIVNLEPISSVTRLRASLEREPRTQDRRSETADLARQCLSDLLSR